LVFVTYSLGLPYTWHNLVDINIKRVCRAIEETRKDMEGKHKTIEKNS
jgi:hypothetical protein